MRILIIRQAGNLDTRINAYHRYSSIKNIMQLFYSPPNYESVSRLQPLHSLWHYLINGLITDTEDDWGTYTYILIFYIFFQTTHITTHTHTHTHTHKDRISSRSVPTEIARSHIHPYLFYYWWAEVTTFMKTNPFSLHPSWDSNPEHLGCETSVLTITPSGRFFPSFLFQYSSDVNIAWL